jgi:hypothetical protein
MNLQEATKKVRAEKPKENFMVVQLDADYRNRLVLPHKDGVTLLEALKAAEMLHDPYDGKRRINEFNRDVLSTSVMSTQEYERHKIAALLDLTIDEVKEMQQAAARPKPDTPTP